MFKNKISLKDSFIKNIMKVTGGTTFAQLLNIIMYPLITRLFSPEEFGIVSVYIAILLSISFLGTMNYELAIPLVDNKRMAINTLLLSLLILAFLTLNIMVLFLIKGEAILRIFNGEALITYQYFIPLGFLLIGLYNIFLQWAYRKKDFNSVTKTKINQSIVQNLVSIITGVFGKSAVGLIIARTLGQSAGIWTLGLKAALKEKHILRNIRIKEITYIAKRYRNFPIYTTPRRFLGDITLSIPILFITSLYGSQIVGLFALANNVIQLPMNLIGNSIGSVFYAESAALSKSNPEKIKYVSNRLLKILLIVGLVPLLVLIFGGQFLFSVFFGSEWVDAGKYASILAISTFFKLVVTPISSIFDVFERQKIALVFNFFKLILVVTVFMLSMYLNLSDVQTIFLYSMGLSVVYILQYILAQRVINSAIKSNLKK